MTSKPGSLKVNHLKWKLSLLTTLMTLMPRVVQAMEGCHHLTPHQGPVASLGLWYF